MTFSPKLWSKRPGSFNQAHGSTFICSVVNLGNQICACTKNADSQYFTTCFKIICNTMLLREEKRSRLTTKSPSKSSEVKFRDTARPISTGWSKKTDTHHFFLITVKEWLKSVLNYRSYPKNKTGYPFLDHPVDKAVPRQRSVR